MNLQPLEDRVVVKAVQPMEKTAGGIFLPDTAKEKPQEGEIVATGPGKYDSGQLVKMTVKKGDRVIYGKYSGTEITVDGEEYMIMRESDLYALITK